MKKPAPLPFDVLKHFLSGWLSKAKEQAHQLQSYWPYKLVRKKRELLNQKNQNQMAKKSKIVVGEMFFKLENGAFTQVGVNTKPVVLKLEKDLKPDTSPETVCEVLHSLAKEAKIKPIESFHNCEDVYKITFVESGGQESDEE